MWLFSLLLTFALASLEARVFPEKPRAGGTLAGTEAAERNVMVSSEKLGVTRCAITCRDRSIVDGETVAVRSLLVQQRKRVDFAG